MSITYAIIGSDNGLSPGRYHAIIWTNAGILLIGPLGTNFNEILITIYAFSFTKIHLKMLSTSTSTSIQDGPGTTKCPLWHKVLGVSLRCRCRYKCRLKSKIHRGDSSDQLKHGIWKSLPLDKLKGKCSMPMYKGGAWVLIHWANCRHAVSGYCPGVVCCPGPLILSAAGVSAWRFQHWGHGQLHEPRIFYPSGHWPETVTNAHVSAHLR